MLAAKAKRQRAREDSFQSLRSEAPRELEHEQKVQKSSYLHGKHLQVPPQE